MKQEYNKQPSYSEAHSLLELFFSCRSLTNKDILSKSDPYIIMQVKKNNQWFEYGRTEIIYDNLNPNFSKSIQNEYYFEIQQYLKFTVYNYNGNQSPDLIGSCETSMAAIAGAKDQVLLIDIKEDNGKKGGKIIIRADQVKLINDTIHLTIRGQNILNTRFFFWHTTCPFLRFYRIRGDGAQPLLVFESEHVSNNRSPQWKKIEIQAQKLCNGDYNMPLKIELWDYRSSGDHVYIGETQISVLELQNEQNIQKQMKDKSNKNVGLLQFFEFKLIEKPSFMEYIAGGTQINLILAIDFTASNQNPQHQSSLHYRDPKGQYNQYQQAMISVGEILLNYDYDKQVPVFGFGCRPHLQTLNSNQTLHCFPINGNPANPEVYGMDGIMQAYNNVLPFLQFDGPTYFNPIITEAMKLAQGCKDQNSDAYFILFILTDGEIHDMQATINSIIAASNLPLSIIIVGVGNADFHNMDVLDNDDMSMRDDKGRMSKRDLVQFVPFNEFRNDPALLAKNVLQELPDQLVQYMMMNNRKPVQAKQINLNNYDLPQDYQQFQKQQSNQDEFNQRQQSNNYQYN